MQTSTAGISAGLSFRAGSQVDSFRLKVSAITLDFHILAEPEHSKETSLSDFRDFVQGDPLLDQTLPEKTNGIGIQPPDNALFFPATLGIRLFSAVKDKNTEAYAGMRIGKRRENSLSFLEQITDTVSSGTNQSGEFVFTAQDYTIAHYFQVTSTVLQFPVGIQYTGNRARMLWFSAGAEICPGITVDYKYKAYFSKGYSTNEYRIDPNTGIKNATSRSAGTTLGSFSSGRKLRGVGFAGYISLPLVINFRPLKQLGIFLQAAPGYFFSDSRYIRYRSSLVLIMNAGFRCQLRKAN
jgi:hypothetical protein